jgi:ATP-binding cassette subfamily C protein CydCD
VSWEPPSRSASTSASVARTLLAERPVLVLDEPTAHLDAVNTDYLHQACLPPCRAREVWITHRLVDLDAFDPVVTMDRGRLLDEDTAVRIASA